MAILRLLLLLVGVVAQKHAVTSPTVRPPTEQLREQHGAEASLVRLVVSSVNILIWSWAFLEGSVLLALSGYCPPALARPLVHLLLPTTLTSDPTALTPAFLVGTFLTLAGALLRAHCFHTLGPRFTFELSIRPAHTLVTDGVYGIVRHPSYTGFAATQIGYLFCVLDRQGPMVSMWAGRILARAAGGNGGHAMVTGVLACMWATGVYMIYLIVYGRMNREDAMLETRFGEEWRVWARRVPWRLVPGVY